MVSVWQKTTTLEEIFEDIGLIINIFPSIDKKMGIESVRNVLLNADDNIPHTKWIIKALELCLNSTNSNFINHHYLQVDNTAQGLHMSCSYSAIALHSYNFKALSYIPSIKCWKRFCDDKFVFLEHSRDYLDNFFNSMNCIHSSKNLIYYVLSCW